MNLSNNLSRRSLSALLKTFILTITFVCAAQAQTTAFTYQGRFTDTSVQQPTNGTYTMTFRLFDAATSGNQIPNNTVAITSMVSVVSNLFTVKLDFGAAAFNTTGARYLEIQVGSTVLTTRQEITAAPFANRAVNAAAADGLSANCVGCVTNAQINSVAGSKITGSVANADSAATATNVSGVVGIANGGTGSTTQNFVDTTTAQTISGDKTFSNTVSGSVVNAATQFNLGGSRVLSRGGVNNLFAGSSAGSVNTTGYRNAFFGAVAGTLNTTGYENSFFGAAAGDSNTTGRDNAFFGALTGNRNTTGDSNAFFGAYAGQANTTGGNNTALGAEADFSANNLNYATAVGAGAVVTASNSIVLGRTNDTVRVPGSLNAAGSVVTNGNLFVVGSVENLRIVRGTFQVSNGVVTITAGSGFTVSRQSTGRYIVDFSPAFSVVPVVIPSVISGATIIGTAFISPTSTTITAFSPNGNPGDPSFVTFIAIGLK